MAQTVQPIRCLRKANTLEEPSSARALREALQAHSVSYEVVADLWGLCKSRTAKILTVLLERLDLLPARVRADWHRRCLAQLEARRTRGVEGECLDLGVASGRLLDEVRAAIADGLVTPEEARRIRDLVASVVAEAEDVATAASLMPAVAGAR